MIGKEGLTQAVADRTDAELVVHELIKVRFVDHKEQVREIAPLLAEQTDAALVQVIGHVAILYRPSPDPDSRHIELPAGD
jgi:RNA-binding protein